MSESITFIKTTLFVNRFSWNRNESCLTEASSLVSALSTLSYLYHHHAAILIPYLNFSYRSFDHGQFSRGILSEGHCLEDNGGHDQCQKYPSQKCPQIIGRSPSSPC